MKKRGLLNPGLNAAIARLGHTDTFVLADARFVVRTGATVPYSNVILRCGVPF